MKNKAKAVKARQPEALTWEQFDRLLVKLKVPDSATMRFKTPTGWRQVQSIRYDQSANKLIFE